MNTNRFDNIDEFDEEFDNYYYEQPTYDDT